MIERILRFSLRQRALVPVLTALSIVLGVWSALRLPIDAVPDITNVQVQINTEVPALAPEEIEQMVTVPLELELAGIQGLVEMRSLSKFGLSQQTLIFSDATDIYRARQLVSERLQSAREKLPEGLQPELAPIATGLSEIYFYTVDYKTNKSSNRIAQLQELTSIQNWTIKPNLRTVPGVAEVISWGGYDKQIVIQPDPARLSASGLSFAELTALIRENVNNAGGGSVEIGSESLVIRSLGRVQSIDELLNISLKFAGGVHPLRVKDVASVVIGSGIRTGAATENGAEAVLGVVLMISGENSRTVSRAVHQRIQDLQAKLPPGVEIRPLYNRSDLVHATIKTVSKNLSEGALLVVAVLFALLGNWRAALMVALVIPLSMLLAICGMVPSGISGNLMSLGAIDFGLIIDGAVVMVENAVRLAAEKQKQLGRALAKDEREEIVLRSGLQVARPMVFGVAIITIVYVPVLALSGIEGKMFRPMAVTVVFALLASLLLALTAIPVLCSFFLKGHLTEEDNLIVRITRRLYAPILNWSLRFRWQPLALAVIPFGIAVALFLRLGAEFIPQLDEGSLVIQMVRANSLALGASLEMQLQAEKVIRAEFPEVTEIFSRIGTPDVATDPMGFNLADTYLTLAPHEKWRKINGRTVTKDELAHLIHESLSVKVPGQENLFTQPIEMRFNEMLEGTRADIAVKIFGHEFQTLEQIAEQVRGILENVPGAAQVAFEPAGRAPALEIVPDRAAMARYNVHSAEINSLVEVGLSGERVGFFVEENRRFPIVVRMAEDNRKDMARLGKLPVSTGQGVLPLEKVAQIKVVDRVNSISREAGTRRVAIMVNLSSRDVEGFVREARSRIASTVSLPNGYSIEFGGQFKHLQEARQRLSYAVPLALLLIFFLIYLTFHDFRQALLVFLCIPLAVTGGVFALLVAGLPFSISASIGFIALSGIAVLNGLMLLTFINQLRDQGLSLREAVLQGSLTRLRPKLMTALVASFGFVPMALATGSGAEVQRPLATVVIGGIISSTFLTLVLLPTLYEWVELKAPRFRRIVPESVESSAAPSPAT